MPSSGRSASPAARPRTSSASRASRRASGLDGVVCSAEEASAAPRPPRRAASCPSRPASGSPASAKGDQSRVVDAAGRGAARRPLPRHRTPGHAVGRPGRHAAGDRPLPGWREDRTMKVSIIGTGYVGLVTGACLADVGNHVLCLDVDERKIAMLRGGEIPDLRAGPARDRAGERGRRAPRVHHRPRGERALRARADDRGRHAAGRGRLGRPAVRARRRARHRHAHGRARASSWTSPPCRSAPPTRCAPRSRRRSRPAARRTRSPWSRIRSS